MNRIPHRSNGAPSLRAAGAWLVALSVLGTAIGGCVIFDEGNPETARLIVTFQGGEAGAGSNLRLIVSNNFLTAQNTTEQTSVTLRSADTIAMTLPYDQEFSLGPDERFFAQIANLDSIPVVLAIQADIDSDRRMDQVTALGEPVEFLYVLSSF